MLQLLFELLEFKLIRCSDLFLLLLEFLILLNSLDNFLNHILFKRYKIVVNPCQFLGSFLFLLQDLLVWLVLNDEQLVYQLKQQKINWLLKRLLTDGELFVNHCFRIEFLNILRAKLESGNQKLTINWNGNNFSFLIDFC